MANAILRNIPNTLTSCNLLSGCIACYMAFQDNYTLALTFIVIGAVFDFSDGMSARLLHVSSPIGKELDSLADDITFGLAPAAIVFSLFQDINYPDFLNPIAGIVPYTAFLIAIFSALRLAKFNIDTRQTSSFIGMPTPANALFWGSLVVGEYDFLTSDSFNAVYLFILVVIMSWLLVAEIPMFSLKFKDLSWKHNKISYIFLIVCIPLFIIFQLSGFAAVIVWYIILSIATSKKSGKQ
ncbi:CDP-diacylglycerol--serine O-phosphatidyltransferase [uncultured Bacteroides sp.]|uniref:CDP-diacylglycerol--serine O-phosphatidyltransferase n=1 Tax=uncultured Bacteroides sp. TaxID=162156 RepID=UPI00261AC9E8|nr:CDP-diacylglycerol--serine O-phosphatidyltransferase [uncultured Bacteroides sp.]